MIEFKPCEAWHIAQIDAQEYQLADKAFYADETNELVANSLALSCWLNGECVGAAGIRPIWEGRAAIWSLLGRKAGPALPAIVKKVRFSLATCPLRRLEAIVREDFDAGCRMVALLGFEREARLAGYFPDGSTALMYSRINQSLTRNAETRQWQ